MTSRTYDIQKQSISVPSAPSDAADNFPAEIHSQVRELKRQIFDLHTLFDVARQFHEVWDVDALLDGILLVAIEHVRVGAAAVTTAGPNDSRLLTRQRAKGWDLSTEPVWTIDLDSAWAQKLKEYRRPLPVEALGVYAADSGGHMDALRKAGCVVVAPMVRHDKLRGVLFLSDKVQKGSYTAGDFAFLDLLMDQFTVSLENAFLYEREQNINDQLMVAKQRLAVAEKLAALGQMAATIAHEVRNPAGIIHNYLSLIRPALAEHPEESRHLDVISEEMGRIEMFVKSLLGAFHPEQSQPTHLALRAQVEQVTGFLKARLAQNHVTVVNHITDSSPKVYAEPEALRQVLLNLMLNGIDAMPKGGTMSFAASADLERVHLSVTDTGAGVPVELLDRLFDAFVTTKREGEGSGLGLSICRSLLERVDAQIGAKNLPAPAHGAVFTLHFRRADAPGRSTQTVPCEATTDQGAK